MSARDDILVGLRTAAGSAIGDETPEALLERHRAEAIAEYCAQFTMADARGIASTHRAAVLREAIDAARGEYLTGNTGYPEGAVYNCGVSDAVAAIGALIEPGKDTRPGTQPGTGESTQAAGFFQPGHTYRSQRHADLIFKCMALSADPDSGEQQAIGWRFGTPRQGIRRYRIAALDADDWNCCDWTEAGGPDA